MFELLDYLFFRNALTACFLTGITCGLIGTYVVNRKMVFISGGISHASFGGLGAGYYLGFNPILGAAVFSVLTALGIEYFSKNSKVRQDSSIGIFWAFGMALGLIFIYITPGYTPNLMGYLFGNILTVTKIELIVMSVSTLFLILFFFVFYRYLLFLSFDLEFMKALKVPVSSFNYFMTVLVALTIVINIRIVGIILVIALLTLPQAIASLFTKNYKNILILSSFWAVMISVSGLVLSYYFKIPSGASIVFLGGIVFFFLRSLKLLVRLFKIQK